MVPVSSSILRAVGHDEASQTLTIRFASGAVYAYRGVPRATFDALLASASPGRYFGQYVRFQYTADIVTPAPKDSDGESA
jgi:hypothetical protein